MIARVLSPWILASEPETAYRPRLLDDYSVTRCTDATGQPAANIIPAVNLVAIEIECDDATLAAIDADPLYEVLYAE